MLHFFRRAGLTASIVLMAASPLISQANTIQVIFAFDNTIDDTDGVCSLAEAILAANNDDNAGEPACDPGGSGADIIEVLNDVGVSAPCSSCGSDNAFPAITSEITIRGVNPGSPISISRDPSGDEMRFFFANADGILTLENMVMQGGLLTNERGGAVWSIGPIAVNNCQFLDNQAAFLGGGALVGGEGMIVENSLFQNNSALDSPSADGGAILTQGPLTVRNTLFIGNESFPSSLFPGRGGAIANQQSDDIVVESCQFIGNKASDGGAIALVPSGGGATLTVSDSTFVLNQASDDGGAIYSESDNDNTVLRTLFDDNQALRGAAISNPTIGVMTVQSSIFSDNVAQEAGGAVLNEGSFTSENSHYLRNTAFAQGGALQQVSGDLTLSGATIQGNQATEGAGLYHEGGTAALTSTSIFANSANSGAGIYSLSTLSLETMALFSNLALNQGGGIYVGLGTAELLNGTFADNSAAEGAGIYNAGGSVLLRNATMTLNFAQSEGGGIYTAAGGSEIENSLLAGNGAALGPDCSGDLTSLGFTLLGDSTSCTLAAGTGDLSGDAGLGAFVASSAPGKAHVPLLSGSQAIDQIDPADCPATDQLGKARNGLCDIGAVEGPSALTPEPSPTPAACGNGIFESGEQCDDGNLADGDGCTANCRTESGFQCFGEPSVCMPVSPPSSEDDEDPNGVDNPLDDAEFGGGGGCSLSMGAAGAKPLSMLGAAWLGSLFLLFRFRRRRS